jgi:hypothetical protein
MANLNQYYGKVDEVWDGRRGVPFNHGGPRTYVRRFLVNVKSKFMASAAVCWHPSLPRPYSSYVSGDGVEYDFSALLVNLSAEQKGSGEKDDWVQWMVTASYSNDLGKMGVPDRTEMPGDPTNPQGTGTGGASNQGGSTTNPEFEVPEREWDWEVSHVAMPTDLDGKPFVNSANQPLTPAPTIEIARPVLVVTRNELTFDVDVATQYAFAVNSDKFFGWEPETIQCLPPRAKTVYRGALEYQRVTYRLRFHGADSGGTWQPQFLDCGTSHIDTRVGSATENQPVPIIVRSAPISHPVLLDGNGQRQIIPAGKVGVAKFIDRRTYNKLPFSWITQKGFTRPPKKRRF